MKREEAIKGLEKLRTQYATAAEIGPTREYRLLFKEATDVLDAALAALRGPTREQVEEVFGTITPQSKSDWYGLEENVWVCTKCNMRISSREEGMNFCAVCGSPITHKGMRILMDRLEALYGKAETD